MWWHSLMAGPSFRSMHSCTVGRFSSSSACPSISLKQRKQKQQNSPMKCDRICNIFSMECFTSETTNMMQFQMEMEASLFLTWSRKIRARGAQSVVLMKRTTSVTLHSRGLVSRHNFWGGSVFEVFENTDGWIAKTSLNSGQKAYDSSFH